MCVLKFFNHNHPKKDFRVLTIQNFLQPKTTKCLKISLCEENPLVT